jgi:hypothetical protein
MTDAWVLIFYLVLISEGRVVGGGPATAEFADQRSCQMALSEIGRPGAGGPHGLVQAEWAICVPKEQGH